MNFRALILINNRIASLKAEHKRALLFKFSKAAHECLRAIEELERLKQELNQ